MNKRILAVEDDADGQEFLATVLAHLRYTCDIASDGVMAEQLLFHGEHRYMGVIIDLALPIKDGWQVLQSIRANAQTHDLPCVAVTAYHTSTLRAEALTAGFNAYFPKPIDTTSFVRQLEQLF